MIRIAPLLALASCTFMPVDQVFIQAPPADLRDSPDVPVLVRFADKSDIAGLCQAGGEMRFFGMPVAPFAGMINGCTYVDAPPGEYGDVIVVVENPCNLITGGWWAEIVCHELGHVNQVLMDRPLGHAGYSIFAERKD